MQALLFLDWKHKLSDFIHLTDRSREVVPSLSHSVWRDSYTHLVLNHFLSFVLLSLCVLTHDLSFIVLQQLLIFSFRLDFDWVSNLCYLCF